VKKYNGDYLDLEEGVYLLETADLVVLSEKKLVNYTYNDLDIVIPLYTAFSKAGSHKKFAVTGGNFTYLGQL
jgi:hypothetical protein